MPPPPPDCTTSIVLNRKTNMHQPRSEMVDALERTVREIEALEAIYNGDGVEVKVLSKDDFERVQSQLETEEEENVYNPPELSIQIQFQRGDTKQRATLTCVLPPGYPALRPAKVCVTLVEGYQHIHRAMQEEMTKRLVEIAEANVGQESMMELVQVLQDCLTEYNKNNIKGEESGTRGGTEIATRSTSNGTLADNSQTTSTKEEEEEMIGRRWIWVHHITDTGRKRDIVGEAKNLHLGGFLKAGYPGIVVVEGPISAYDEFVVWIKGNKSRPGGFGRNWGHHVRGEIVVDERKLPTEFQDLEEDLAVLSAVCKDAGLEAEFLEYVMQHKVAVQASSGKYNNNSVGDED